MTQVSTSVLLLSHGDVRATTSAWDDLADRSGVAADVTVIDVTADVAWWHDVPGLDAAGLALVAESSSVPGPELLTRMGAAAQRAGGGVVVDARVLPVELTVPQADASTPVVSGACVLLPVSLLPVLGAAWATPLSSDTGPGLAELARAAGVSVVSEPSATVFRDVRLDTEARPLAPEDPATVETSADDRGRWAGVDLHPAALPATSLHRLLSRHGLDRTLQETPDDAADRPFLTIVTRTQGTRPRCLEDVLTCLSGQTDRDFELVLVCHRAAPAAVRHVRSTLENLPDWLRQRVRLLEVERPGRAAPLNEGFTAARGRYVVMLDDDDTVLAHWVRTFRDMEATAAGRLLRTIAVRQDVVPLDGAEVLSPVSVGELLPDWPPVFEILDHLRQNHSPCMVVAFPRGVFHDLGCRFDESLDTTEDWDFLIRTAGVVGVESAPVVTAVYRWWLALHSSRDAHSLEEWEAARLAIVGRLEAEPLLMTPADLGRVWGLHDEALEKIRELHASQHKVILDLNAAVAAHDHAVDLWQRAEARVRRRDERLEKRTARFKEHVELMQAADRVVRPHASQADVPSVFELSIAQLKAVVKAGHASAATDPLPDDRAEGREPPAAPGRFRKLASRFRD